MGAENLQKVPIERALDLTGFGKYNLFLTLVCCLSMLGTMIEMFGISFISHLSSCDLELNLQQRGVLSGVPMTGVVITAYAWGYLTDVKGRRTALLVSMAGGFLASFLSSFAPNLTSMTIFKFISMSFASSSFSASYTYLGEFLPVSYRDKILTMLSVANCLTDLVLALIGYPLLTYLNFSYDIPLIGIIFRPWRLLSIILSLPMGISALCLIFMQETPKFLLINDREEEAIAVLRNVYKWNTGSDQYPVCFLEIEKMAKDEKKVTLLKSLRQQCEPLIRNPLLKYTVIIYVSLFCACLVGSSFSMWYPYIFHKFSMNLNIGDMYSNTFCTVFNHNSTSEIDHFPVICDDSIDMFSYIAIGSFGIGGCIISIMIAFLLKVIEKKSITIYLLSLNAFSAFILYWIPHAVTSLIIFIFVGYSTIIVGIMPIFIVDVFPTHVRGMAGCLSMMISRLGSSLGSYLTGIIFEPYCEITLFAASGIIFLCVVLSFMLPSKKSDK